MPKKIMQEADLVLDLVVDFPQLVVCEFEVFKNAKVISIDVSKDELTKKGIKINHKIKDLNFLFQT